MVRETTSPFIWNTNARSVVWDVTYRLIMFQMFRVKDIGWPHSWIVWLYTIIICQVLASWVMSFCDSLSRTSENAKGCVATKHPYVPLCVWVTHVWHPIDFPPCAESDTLTYTFVLRQRTHHIWAPYSEGVFSVLSRYPCFLGRSGLVRLGRGNKVV